MQDTSIENEFYIKSFSWRRHSERMDENLWTFLWITILITLHDNGFYFFWWIKKEKISSIHISLLEIYDKIILDQSIYYLKCYKCDESICFSSEWYIANSFWTLVYRGLQFENHWPILSKTENRNKLKK
jgi:hypothetical protein